ncbi:MAG: threonine synthase [Oscillospiraceae bacterium]|nr:threonine synthase [Oscillospiraceae bacterium]
MKYISTRDSTQSVSSAQAIVRGISRESGLFVPETLPRLSGRDFAGLLADDYIGRAGKILSRFLTDFTDGEIKSCVNAAYGSGKFPQGNPVPIVKLAGGVRMLELWHGPTCAFKDMALQLLPRLLTVSMGKEAPGKEIVILVATSGDTGKAALEGFADVPGTRILVFYPQDGVSNVQKLQMTTQDGANVSVMGVRGNFDDAQTGVKQIFTDPILNARLAEKGLMFSSANSINWGRLVPQIVYYISAYLDLVKMGDIAMGDKINICVPTGNFGNILAAYYAREMGVPVGMLICASNENKVLADFIRTGIYDRRRELVLTTSPSMDILISSNLERLLFSLCEGDSDAVSAMMSDLAGSGVYTIPAKAKEKLGELFWGGFCTEAEVMDTIKETFEGQNYLADTHTAVALRVHGQYVRETGDTTAALIASTADPFKFAPSILTALTGKASEESEFGQIAALEKIAKRKAPIQIGALKNKPERFTGVVDKHEMARALRRF